jgi:hypothetical protein
MATPHVIIMKMVSLATGESIQYACTATDVNAAFWIFPDGLPNVVLPSTKGILALVDVVISPAPTSTTTASIQVNGKDTGERVMVLANLGTNSSRQYAGTPLYFPPGARVQVTQLT